ncbi:MAG: glycosyltransferase family 39 protein [Ilumatobacteraceae bacterium]
MTNHNDSTVDDDVIDPLAPAIADASTDCAVEEPVRLDRIFWRYTVAVTMLGAAIRVVILISKWNEQPKLNDSIYYAIQAQQNADGHWFKEPLNYLAQGAEHAPLTSLVLTPAGIIHDAFPWMRLTMTVIGILVVPLIAVLGRSIAGRRVGIVAALFAAVYPNIWMTDSLVMSETLCNLGMVLALLAAVRHRAKFTCQSALWLGAACGFAALARAEVLLAAPLFALIGIRARPKPIWLTRVAMIGVATFLVISPWVLYNLGRFDAPVLMSTNEGSTLLGANCPATYSGPSLGGWELECLGAPRPSLEEDTSERNSRRRQEAIDYANGHRSRIPIVVGARVGRMLDLYGWSSQIRGDVGEERYRWAIIAGMLSWGVLAPAAAIGWWRSRRTSAVLLVVPAICVAAVAVVFYGGHRLRSPIETALVVAAAIGYCGSPRVQRLIDRVLDRTGDETLARRR